MLIRAAVIGDVPVMLTMLQESARDQGFPHEVAVGADDLRADGFGPHPRFHTLIAEVDGTPAGLAIFFVNYSTWISRLGLYLEDLYVRPPYRSQGVAGALLYRLAAIAKSEGCGRFQWMVHRENHRAIQVYESAGARAADDWLMMMVKGADLDALAARDGT